MDRLKQIPKHLLDVWNKYTRKQKGIIISVVAIVIVALIILAVVIQRPNMQVVTTCSSYTEMGEVTKLLTDNGYAYTTDDATMSVSVDKANVTKAKMVLAAGNIQSDGYTLDDAMKNDFSTTEADKLKKWQSYLESKFAKDLATMDGIKSATVTVVLPEKIDTFYGTTSEASVSAVLTLEGNSVNDDKANTIAQFLATSVGNKNTDKITIISTAGTTLFSGADSSDSGGGGTTSLNTKVKYKAQIESTIKTSLKQNLLATHLYDDAQITMNLSLNWDAINEIATKYTAQEGREEGLFSTSSVEKSTGGGGTASGVAGTSSNSSDTSYTVSNGNGSTSEYTVSKYAYLPDVIVTTTNKQPGAVIYADSSMTISLVKNVIYDETEATTLGYLNGSTWDQFKAANAASKPITVDPNWLTAISTGTGIATGKITVLAYEVPYFVDAPESTTAKTVTFWLQIVLAIVILGILAFVIIRSAKPLTVEEKEPELSVEEMLATTKENQPSIDNIGLQDKSETRKAIEKFVDENPEAVALLLRNWLNDGWE
ncbi:flagellar M-ring protein FliF [[Clostridium] fimetarium]|uniref:Flagellar M-ring protein FliF n=1 Tax=[Clostridium] fimetarium TaxID=99656 RepID=A0A1I0N0N0_9FIRM|nr:flagellar M-ring protein FliF [[Clostridium] fimetarium]SEV94640.1 flagellar M-ring protein FliF [[Clostridium] fimetarium]